MSPTLTFCPGLSRFTHLPAVTELIVCVAFGVVGVRTQPDIYLVWLGEVA